MDLQTDTAGNDGLARAVAHISGLQRFDDDGELAASLVFGNGLRLVFCESEAGVFDAVEAGNIGCIDIDPWSLAVAPVGNGTYLCTSDGWGDWIASSIDVARAWLRAGVGEDVITDSPPKTVC